LPTTLFRPVELIIPALAVLQARLRAALNVVHMEEVFEDKKNVYVVMQQCTGMGQLPGCMD